MDAMSECRSLSDEALTRELRFLSERERHGTSRMLSHLAEFDRRQLCTREGMENLYDYCVKRLCYDEADAYRRVKAARVVRAFPEALKRLEQGKLTLSSLVVLHRVLNEENARAWFEEAQGKTRRELEALVAARHPEPARPDLLRRTCPGYVLVPAPEAELSAGAPPEALEALPTSSDGPVSPSSDEDASGKGSDMGPVEEWQAMPGSPARLGWGWQRLAPISADRVRVAFDAADRLSALIERARQVLRHKYPEGRLEDIVREALELLLDKRDPQRKLELKVEKARQREVEGAPEIPGRLETRYMRAWQHGRYIPARIKSAVWQRDRGRCSWRHEDGTACGSMDWIEYDHIRPFAKGGRSDDPRNIRLLCRRHNQEAAVAAFPEILGGTAPDTAQERA